MPLGFERLNERTQRPNAQINFIKTVSEGPDKAIAEEFLSRIAAQCYPVMKKHYISVMALEEFPPNPEFLGRNFNAGEVIQLVLKDKAGRWLSFKFVQMVMMHELAHCKQMNHSRFFWHVRNEYAKQMEDLWMQKYEGEGIWGRGRGLATGAFIHAQPPDNTQIPEHLCGGSYRRKGRKRKRGASGTEDGEKMTYAERQQKRIQRKFGKHGISMNGEALGDDELTRGALERMNGGKRSQGKPRVANSKRGRELRANAALARFEALKQPKPPETAPKSEHEDSETESEWELDTGPSTGKDAIVISDGKGRDLVKVCGDGEDDEEGANREMDELKMLSRGQPTMNGSAGNSNSPIREDSETESEVEEVKPAPKTKPRLGAFKGKAKAGTEKLDHNKRVELGSATESEPGVQDNRSAAGKSRGRSKYPASGYQAEKGEADTDVEEDIQRREEEHTTTVCGKADAHSADQPELARELNASNAAFEPDNSTSVIEPSLVANTIPAAATTTCSICSLHNDPNSPICMACSNVLRPALIPNHWRCKSETCKGSKYINAGDVGRCGLCGAQQPKPGTNGSSDTAGGRGMGITRPDVLRWD